MSFKNLVKTLKEQEVEEAVVTGEHTDVASGETTGAVTNGAEKKKKKEVKIEVDVEVEAPKTEKELDEKYIQIAQEVEEVNEEIEFVDDKSMITGIHALVDPLLYTELVGVQPTLKPRATAFYQRNVEHDDDGSGWKSVGFELHRTEVDVEDIKVKTLITTEARQDLQALGLGINSEQNTIAQSIADTLNETFITRLHEIAEVDSSTLDVSSISLQFDKGRELYALIHSRAHVMEDDARCGYRPTACTVGKVAFDLLAGCGMCEQLDTRQSVLVANSGLIIIKDESTNNDIVLVAKHEIAGEDGEGLEIAPIIWSPYFVNDSFISTHDVTDPKSLHTNRGVLARSAFCPLVTDPVWSKVTEVDWSSGLPTDPKPMKSQYALKLDVVL